MNKTNAIHAMHDGHKITHGLFTSDEWIRLNSDKTMYEFENTHKCSPDLFWSDREHSIWQDGWSIYQESPKRVHLQVEGNILANDLLNSFSELADYFKLLSENKSPLTLSDDITITLKPQ